MPRPAPDSIRVSTFAAICLLAIASISEAHSEEVCPAKLKSAYSGGGYTFGYQSWSWPDAKDSRSLLICHCVRNADTNRALWVEWTKTGLSGFLAPSGTLYSYVSIAGGEERKEKVDLWYGAQPSKLEVVTAFNSKQEAPVALTAENSPPEKPDQPEYSSGQSEGTLLSSASVAVPNLPDWAAGPGTGITIKEIRLIVESHPEFLSPMEMRFESAPRFDAGGQWVSIENKCTYSIRATPRAEHLGPFGRWGSYRMRIQDAKLNASVFHSDGAISFERLGTGPAVFSGITQVSELDAAHIKRHVSQLQILAGSDVVVASMPITYYAVEMPKVATNRR
jgi:hypothetical protein